MKNSQNAFVVPLLISIVLILIAGGGLYYYAKYNEPFEVITDDPKGTTTNPIVGGDRDSHGCIGSAGYSWCEIKNKCLRTWEEKCEATSTPAISCKSDNDCREISCPSTGGFAHEQCIQEKCALSDEARIKCSPAIPVLPPSSPIVISPNGGEVLKIGDVYTISWLSLYTNYSSSVNITIFANLSGCYYPNVQVCLPIVDPIFTLVSDANNVGSYKWTVGNFSSAENSNSIRSGKYLLKICDNVNKNVCDISDNYFEIK
ncbi:MAG: hypothetical protein WCW14_02290 [Candidatus Paceibacterota bacterium]|jgi:hypothetical protein